MTDPRTLYLELLKRTLTGTTAEDNDVILGGVRTGGRERLRMRAAGTLGRLAERAGVEIALKKPFDAELRAQGRDWPSRSESMIGLRRMDNIRQCVESVLADDVPGDLIETGVWRGGGCIFMRGVLAAHDVQDRKVWVADSFQGLPAPDVARFPADSHDRLFEEPGLSIGVAAVRRNFERYGLLDDQVVFLEGWFKDTLPTAPIEQIAVLRLDGDMYESTWQAIEALYPKLSPGGYCIVDDWGSHPTQAQRAAQDYRQAHGYDEEVVDIDGYGAYWRRAA